MVTSKHVSFLVGAALVCAASAAHAEPSAAPAPAVDAAVPALHHAPQVTARLAEDISIGAVVDRPDRVKRALLVFQGGGTHGEVEFARASGPLGYVAIIPATAVRPDLGYSIEIETTTGEQLQVFATRAAPHHVTVLDSPEDLAKRRSSRGSTAGGRSYRRPASTRTLAPPQRRCRSRCRQDRSRA